MKALITDHEFPDIENEKRIFEAAGIKLTAARCRTPQEVIDAARDVEALLVQWAPITREVITALPKCKVIVRYGIGTDSVDIVAATEREIAVCNVPD